MLVAIVESCTNYISDKLIATQYIENGASIRHRPLCFKINAPENLISVTFAELGPFNHFATALSDLYLLYPNVLLSYSDPTDIAWESPQEKAREWQLAKEKLCPDGKLAPNGTKLGRNEIASTLRHSFMVLDNRIIAISGQGIYLGNGAFSNVKLAEDEYRQLIALKIIVKYDSLETDDNVAFDCGLAGVLTQRIGSTKLYIAYQYLGISLLEYLRFQKISLDHCYELGIKAAIALYKLHRGKHTKSGKPIAHNDVSLKNMVINQLGELNFIDYERAESNAPHYHNNDIQKLLEILSSPLFGAHESGHAPHSELFYDWFMDSVQFHYGAPPSDMHKKLFLKKQAIYLYLKEKDYFDGGFAKIYYASRDAKGKIYEGSITLSPENRLLLIDLDDIAHLRNRFPIQNDYVKAWQSIDFMLTQDPQAFIEWKQYPFPSSNINADELESMILNTLRAEGYVINPPIKKAIVKNLLHGYIPIHSALNIAEVLTLSRFDLEAYLEDFQKHTENERLSAIHVLNTLSKNISMLYAKLLSYTKTDPTPIVKAYLFSDFFDLQKPSLSDLYEHLSLITESSHICKIIGRIHLLEQQIQEEKMLWMQQNGRDVNITGSLRTNGFPSCV